MLDVDTGVVFRFIIWLRNKGFKVVEMLLFKEKLLIIIKIKSFKNSSVLMDEGSMNISVRK